MGFTMKYYALFFAAIIGALLAGVGYSTQAKTAPTNLLVNGDFETGQREPWVFNLDDFLFGGISSLHPHTGAYDLQLALGSGNYTGLVGGGGSQCPNSSDPSFQPFQVTPNASYQLSGYVWMQTPNGNLPEAYLTVIWYSGCSSELGISEGSIGVLQGIYGEFWQHTQGIVTAPDNAQYALIGLGLRYSSDRDSKKDGPTEDYPAYFDDITLNEVPTPPTPTITPVPPRCTGERFTDVCPGDYFYQHVLDLNDLGILSGYNSTPPCENASQVPCFKPNNQITRGQMAKIISNAAGFTEPAGARQFEDVPPGSTFYDFIWRLANRDIVVGYPCGSNPSEPCGIGSLPYYRVNANVNRAQMAKFTALAFGFQDTPTSQSFEDVVPDNHFYPFIENLASRNIIGGYPCGGPGEPCGAGNLPYYRYGTLVTRGQAAKIVNLARIIVLPTPTAVPTASATATPEATATP